MKHPARGVRARQYVLAAVLGVIGLALLALGSPIAGASFLALGAVFVWIGSLFGATAATQAIHAAVAALARNQPDEALARVREVEGQRLPAHLQRAAHQIRARVALVRSDPRAAIEHADRALAIAPRVIMKGVDELQLSSARGVRALAHALAGAEPAALEDARAARREDAPPDAWANASLAEAVIAARKGDRARLREIFRVDKRLLLEQLPPRERALARALSRLARAEKTSVYREPAKQGGDPALAWVAGFVPEAAQHVERAPSEPLPQVSAAAMARVGGARQQAARAVSERGKPRHIALAAAVSFVVVGFALGVPSMGSSVAEVVAPVLVVLFMGAVAWNMRAVQSQQARLRRVLRGLLRGSDDVRDALALTKSRLPYIAAEAELLLADQDERRGDFASAIARCDRAIALIGQNPATRAAAHDVLLPLAIAARAFSLAAARRVEEADAELANLARFESSPYLAASLFRGRLARALAQGDRAGALALARSRTLELPLSHRVELLCDLLEVRDQGERERLESELAEDPQLTTFVEHFLPGARARLTATRVALEDEALEDESLEDESLDDPSEGRALV